MNNEVEAYVGELRELREENQLLRERVKEVETELAWNSYQVTSFKVNGHEYKFEKSA